MQAPTPEFIDVSAPLFADVVLRWRQYVKDHILSSLLVMNLNVADMPVGYYNIYARNASITKPSSEMLYLNDTSAIVNGDQNGDNQITGSDVTAVYNIILGI